MKSCWFVIVALKKNQLTDSTFNICIFSIKIFQIFKRHFYYYKLRAIKIIIIPFPLLNFVYLGLSFLHIMLARNLFHWTFQRNGICDLLFNCLIFVFYFTSFPSAFFRHAFQKTLYLNTSFVVLQLYALA